MRAHEFVITEEDNLVEGKLGKAAGAAALAGAVGLAGHGGYKTYNQLSTIDTSQPQKVAVAPAQKKQDLSTIQAKSKPDAQKSAQTKPEIKTDVQKSAQKVNARQQQKFKVKPLTNQQLERILMQVARAEGITGVELAAFMAQMHHESAGFSDMVENNPNIKKYGSGKTAKALGNKNMNDAKRFIGRGFIQLTGRWNYEWMSKELGMDLVTTWSNAHQASDPYIAAKIAVVYWKKRVQPHVDNYNDVKAVTKKINPGLHGLKRRANHFVSYMTLASNDTNSI